jgi:hypothetical protein
MSLLARSVATLEGIALTGDPSYQMVAQVCPCLPRVKLDAICGHCLLVCKYSPQTIS